MSLRLVETGDPPTEALALSIGPHARVALTRVGRPAHVASTFSSRVTQARIAASFARSLHIEAGDDVLCLVTPEIGDGALNIVVDNPAWFARIEPGEVCMLSDSEIRVGAIRRLALRGARFWRPAPVTIGGGIRGVVDALVGAARAPRDGAFRAALDPSYVADTPMQRALAARTRDFSEWLVRARSSSHAAPPLAGLIGLGSGLTPAGDDFVGGAMIAARAVGVSNIADRLARAIDALDQNATTRLSRAMLRAAADGAGGATLHEIIAAISDGDAPRAIHLLGAVDRIGHTSGWDALAGALITLRSMCALAKDPSPVIAPR